MGDGWRGVGGTVRKPVGRQQGMGTPGHRWGRWQGAGKEPQEVIWVPVVEAGRSWDSRPFCLVSRWRVFAAAGPLGGVHAGHMETSRGARGHRLWAHAGGGPAAPKHLLPGQGRGPAPRPQSRCPFAKGGLAGCRRGNAGLRDCRVWGERHSPVMAWGPGPPGERPLLQPTSTAPSGQLGGRGAAGPPLQCSPGTWGARVTAVSSEGDIPGFEGTLSSHPWLRGPFALRLSRHVGHQSF